MSSHSDSAGERGLRSRRLVDDQSPGRGDTSTSPGPGPPEPLGFPVWQQVCFPRKSTLQGSVWGSARLAHKGVSVPSRPSMPQRRALR